MLRHSIKSNGCLQSRLQFHCPKFLPSFRSFLAFSHQRPVTVVIIMLSSNISGFQETVTRDDCSTVKRELSVISGFSCWSTTASASDLWWQYNVTFHKTTQERRVLGIQILRLVNKIDKENCFSSTKNVLMFFGNFLRTYIVLLSFWIFSLKIVTLKLKR